MHIAVHLAYRNRRDTTVSCLEALSRQCVRNNAALTIYLVENEWADGTAAAVMRRLPAVRIIAGDD